MEHHEHVRLLREGVPAGGGVWADLGSGRGAFTLALAELIGPGGMIYSVDRDNLALQVQMKRMQRLFPDVHLCCQTADYRQPLELPPLDGILMANTLHFQRDPAQTVRHLRRYIKPGGRLLIVEYNIQHGNPAVPYPLPYITWVKMARQAGFAHTHLLATRPSSTMREIYSAFSLMSVEV